MCYYVVNNKQRMPVPSFPHIPDGRPLYDSIMGRIEPQLVSDNLPRLESVLAEQTEEQRLATRRRHRSAIERYRKEYDAFVSHLDGNIRRFKAAV